MSGVLLNKEMKSKTFTVTTANINAGTNQTIDPEISIVISGTVPDTIHLFPSKMKIVNSTGRNVEFVIISNTTELTEFTADPTNYGFQIIPNATTEQILNLPMPYRFIVRGLGAGTATSDLRIDFSGYTVKNIMD